MNINEMMFIISSGLLRRRFEATFRGLIRDLELLTVCGTNFKHMFPVLFDNDISS